MPVEDIEPDMLPPTGRTVRDVFASPDKPAGKTAKAAPRKTQAAVKEEWETLQEDLQSAYEFLGFTLIMARLPNGGMAMQENAERASHALVEQAKRSPRFHRWLIMASTGGGWIAIAVAHMPIAMAVMGDLQNLNAGPQGVPDQTMGEQMSDLLSEMDKAG